MALSLDGYKHEIDWSNPVNSTLAHAYIAEIGDTDLTGVGSALTAVGVNATKDATGWNTLYGSDGYWEVDGLSVNGRNITIVVVANIIQYNNNDIPWGLLSSTDSLLAREYMYNGDLRHRNNTSASDLHVATGNWLSNVKAARVYKFSQVASESKIFENNTELPIAIQEGSTNTTAATKLRLGSASASSNPTQQVEAVLVFNSLLTDSECLDISDNPYSILKADLAGASSSVTEVLKSLSDSSVLDVSYNVSINATETLGAYSDNSIANISNEATTISTTETLNTFVESALIDVSLFIAAIDVNAQVTESLNSFYDSSNVTIDIDVDAQITDQLNSYSDNSVVKLPISFTVNPKNAIRVKRQNNAIRVKRKSNTVRVK